MVVTDNDVAEPRGKLCLAEINWVLKSSDDRQNHPGEWWNAIGTAWLESIDLNIK